MTNQHSAPLISVSGDAEIDHGAERGTVRLTIGFQGPRRDDIIGPTERLHAELTTVIRELHDDTAGPVTRWSSEQVRVWGHRPWNNQGKQLPIVHQTGASFSVEFSDFTRLGAWVTEVSLRDGVTVDGVAWELTERTRAELTADVQRQAVAAAVTKATVYAESLGFSRVQALAVSDPGLLTDGGGTGTTRQLAAFAGRSGAAAAESGGLELAPRPITVSAAVHARFVAE